MKKLSWRAFVPVCGLILFTGIFVCVMPLFSHANGISTYSDTITESRPAFASNHTFSFTILKAVAPGGSIDITFPSDFEILSGTGFGIRDIELSVNGAARPAAATASAGTDGIAIVPGFGGSIVYTLNSSYGLQAGDHVKLVVGNTTTLATQPSQTFSTSTGTTTIAGDIEPIMNSTQPGTHLIDMDIYGSSDPVLYVQFAIAIVPAITTGQVDTTTTVPPYRYNGAPTGTLSGTTQKVELSLNTDKFAICKYSQVASTSFQAMPYTFSNTGFHQIQHSTVVTATTSVNTYYVRCIDLEGNTNPDDYAISFIVPPAPTGTPNASGTVEGNGSGSSNNGAGSTGAGGSSSGSGGGSTAGAGSAGAGSSGAGGGGGTGGSSGSGSGGGFETTAGPYQSGDAQVIVSGYAFPNSTVSVVVDGYLANTARADGNGLFSVTIEKIAKGVYTFGTYATGGDGIKSSTFSTSFTVTGGRASALSNINLAPSVSVKPNPVTPGTDAVVSGYALPNASITIENEKSGGASTPQTFTATANQSGVWSVTIPTSGLVQGTYKVRAKAVSSDGTIATDFSDYTSYGVGAAAPSNNSDLNSDGKVNLTDFSILLYWWGTAGGDSNPPADINGDGTVSLTDFSIMLFNWTG